MNRSWCSWVHFNQSGYLTYWCHWSWWCYHYHYHFHCICIATNNWATKTCSYTCWNCLDQTNCKYQAKQHCQCIESSSTNHHNDSYAKKYHVWTHDCWNYTHNKKSNHSEKQHHLETVYHIGANTTALLIITASRVNSNIKAPKLLNLNNTTASWL